MTRAQQKTALFVVLVAALLALLWWQNGSGSSEPSQPPSSSTSSQSSSPSTPSRDGLATVDVAQLPDEAVDTIELIEQGGPFPYPGKDGDVFQNREGLLPDEPRGFYREYTVPTPGEDDRGARRIVTGGATMYWTDNHYRSFARITGLD